MLKVWEYFLLRIPESQKMTAPSNFCHSGPLFTAAHIISVTVVTPVSLPVLGGFAAEWKSEVDETHRLCLYDVHILRTLTAVPRGGWRRAVLEVDPRSEVLLWSRASCYWDMCCYEWPRHNALFLKSGHWQRFAFSWQRPPGRINHERLHAVGLTRGVFLCFVFVSATPVLTGSSVRCVFLLTRGCKSRPARLSVTVKLCW